MAYQAKQYQQAPATPFNLPHRRARFLPVCAVFAALAFSGCAGKVAINTTRFNQWPSHAQNVTYTINPTVVWQEQVLLGQKNVQIQQSGQAQLRSQPLPELQAQTYQAHLSQGLQVYGLVPARHAEQARMRVEMSVQTRNGIVEIREPQVMPSLWLGFGGGHWRYGGLFSFPIGYNVWSDRIVRRPVQAHRLRVVMTDKGAQTKNTQAPTVFDGSAEYVGKPVALNQVMPQLIRAVLHNFPGVNGQTNRVLFNEKNGRIIAREKRSTHGSEVNIFKGCLGDL